jgi:hypothetical protein
MTHAPPASRRHAAEVGTLQPHRRLGRRRTRLAIAAGVLALLAGAAVILSQSRSPERTPAPTPPLTTAKSALQWAPPVLSHPKIIELSASDRELILDEHTDYRLVLPKTPLTVRSGLSITGGHNIVLIGGTLLVPSSAQAPDSQQRRAVYLKGQTGVVHIEGVRLGGDLSEGFDLDERLGATVQIENVQVDTVHGSRDTNHADVIQTWAGPARLLVDGLRANSDYQGLFLLPNQHWTDGAAPQAFDIRRSVITLTDGAGYGLWVPDSAPWLHASGLTIVEAHADRGRVLWPAPQLTDVRVVAPRSGGTAAELPAGTPGTGYRSPGYKSSGVQ